MEKERGREREKGRESCLVYTSEDADDLSCVDLGGRSIRKKKRIKEEKYKCYIVRMERRKRQM